MSEPSAFKNFMARLGGAVIAFLIFFSTLYFLLAVFVKRDETSDKLRKEYTFVAIPDEAIYDQFYVAPGAKLRIKLLTGERVIYDQLYEHDQHMFRIPRIENEAATYHAIFAGCSFSWGEGLPNELSIATQFQNLVEDVQGYNHSFPGGGLHSLLRYHDFIDLKEAVRQEKGIFFYTFIPTHIDRFFARYNYLTMAPEFAPHYLVINGELVHKGFMKDQDIYKLFLEAKKKNLADSLIRSQEPMKWTKTELNNFMIAVKRLQELYLEKFPRGRFIFLFYPIGVSPTQVAEIGKAIAAQKIEYIDLSHEYGLELMRRNMNYEQMVIPRDGHPNALANELAATALANYLRKAGLNLKWRSSL